MPSGVNLKYTDCNGDGIINAIDTSAILLNYGQNHPLRPEGGGLELFLNMSTDTIWAGVNTSADVELGTDLNPVNNLYGIAFTIGFDHMLIDSSSVSFQPNPCWFSNASNRISIGKTFGSQDKICIAITRINHSDTSGYGTIGTLHFKGILNESGNTFPTSLTTSNVMAIDKDGNIIPVSGSEHDIVIIDSAFATDVSHTEDLHVTIEPNPFNDACMIKWNSGDCGSSLNFDLFDAKGLRRFSSRDINNNFITFKKDDLPAGLYFFQLYSKECSVSGKLMVY